MEDPHSSFYIVLLALLLSLSFFFSSSETALMSINKLRIRSMAEQGDPSAGLIRKLIAQPDRLLSTILIGNNMVNIAASSIATALFLKWFGTTGIALATLTTMVFVLVLGEITPKTLAATQPERVSFYAARPISWMMWLFHPLVVIFSWISTSLIRLFRFDSQSSSPALTEEELKTIVTLGQEQGILDRDEREMIEGVFDFGDLNVGEILTPRVDLFALPAGMTILEAAKKIMNSPYSRIPIYESSIDQIIGVVHVKDVLRNVLSGDDGLTLQAISRAPFFIPEGKKVDQLFEELRREKNHMAVVIDEYGATAGIVTLEDLIEEIVGDIHDEYDDGRPLFSRIDPQTYLVDGNLSIRDANDLLGVNLPTDEADTLAGYVLNRLGHLPQRGESIMEEDVVLTVEEVAGHRIAKLRIQRPDRTE